jgi:hypothetical protein
MADDALALHLGQRSAGSGSGEFSNQENSGMLLRSQHQINEADGYGARIHSVDSGTTHGAQNFRRSEGSDC